MVLKVLVIGRIIRFLLPKDKHPNPQTLSICYFTWQKGLCKYDYFKIWKEVGTLSSIIQADPVQSQESLKVEAGGRRDRGRFGYTAEH